MLWERVVHPPYFLQIRVMFPTYVLESILRWKSSMAEHCAQLNWRNISGRVHHMLYICIQSINIPVTTWVHKYCIQNALLETSFTTHSHLFISMIVHCPPIMQNYPHDQGHAGKLEVAPRSRNGQEVHPLCCVLSFHWLSGHFGAESDRCHFFSKTLGRKTQNL